MKFLGRRILIERELSELDIFTLDFIKTLRKYSSYAVISGYVSILLGRARSSEDVDILIPRMDYVTFRKLLHDIRNSGFYCINAESDEDIYGYIKEKIAVRFAKHNTVIPNIELKCAKNDIDDITLSNTLTVELSDGDEMTISSLEMQVAFKEQVLKSQKDIEDARHIRNVAAGHLDKGLIKKYEEMLDGFYG